jgi:glucokinase
MTTPLVLLADIGGTNARFALADTELHAPLLIDSVRQFEVTRFPSLADAARFYLDALPGSERNPDSAVFAIAGRIEGDEARITNPPWVISRNATREALGLSHLRLVNDFAAQAMAVALLTDDDLVTIGGATLAPRAAGERTYAVVGPGTGLGVSALIVRNGQRLALETEGGHVSFSASTADEIAILERLSRHFGSVSNERLISGGGLVNIHRALSEIAGDEAPNLRPQDITAGAASGDERCQRTVEVFCTVFGSIAGNLVLTLGAWDGVFLTGGLVPKLLTDLQRPAFRQRFEDKGRFSEAMLRVPTVAVAHPQAGLLGAAAFAMQDVRS